MCLMTAAQVKEHEDDTVRRKREKKVGNKARKNKENRTQGVRSNEVFRLCYKAEQGTLSHHKPSF